MFNLHAVRRLTWDGRIFRDANGIVRTPGGLLPLAMRQTFEFGALSAQPMFPVLSRPEMRASAGNELAAIPDTRPQDIWRLLMTRIGNNAEYRSMFEQAYPGQRFDSMTFAHASNAIGGFIADRLAFADTPWDRFLAGDNGAMSEAQLRGAGNFLRGRCAICHNGPALTDGKFHNVALAQIGPGFGDGVGGRDDFGRMRVTRNPAERYAFRTPPLRNVELTAPYGHDGAIVGLRSFVDHYSQSDVKLRAYNAGQLEPALRGTLLPTAADILATRDPLLSVIVLPPEVVDDITEFLKALTDPAARDLRHLVPARVPSGLPVDNLP